MYLLKVSIKDCPCLVILNDIVDSLLHGIHDLSLYFDKRRIAWNRASNCDCELEATISISISIETID
jgi:hypothetical protein